MADRGDDRERAGSPTPPTSSARCGVAVERVGGPVSAWHLDRVTACIAQAQGRYAEAAAVGRRGFDRMRAIEPAPATGAYFALQCALAGHVGVSVEAEAFLGAFESPPRFRTIQRLSQAVLLLRRGPRRRGRRVLPAGGPARHLVAAGVLRAARLRLRHARHRAAGPGRRPRRAARPAAPYRGEHAIGGGVAYLGPVALALGRGAVALGRLDEAVDDLARRRARDRAGAPGYVAEAATTSPRPCSPAATGRPRAGRTAAAECAGLVAALGMAAYAEPDRRAVGRLSRPTTRCSARGRRRWRRWSPRASPTGRSPSGW